MSVCLFHSFIYINRFIFEILPKYKLFSPDVCYKNHCNFYSTCKAVSEKSYMCVCPRKISKFSSKVCGTNGRTYINERVLRQESCLKHVEITVAYKGICRELI